MDNILFTKLENKADVKLEEVELAVFRFIRKFQFTTGPINLNDDVIVFSNKLVFNSNFSSEGFKLLGRIIHRVSQEVMTSYGQKWMLRIFSKEEMTAGRMEVLCEVIKNCNGSQDFDKFFYSNWLKVISRCIVMYKDQYLLEKSFECLSICIQKYPKACSHEKVKIQSYVNQHFGVNSSGCLIENIRSVFCNMHKMDPSPESSWSQLFHKLCATLHTLYDKFFMDGIEYSSYDHYSDVTPFEIETSSISIGTIVNNTVTILSCMIRMKTDMPKKVSLQDLLNVIVRGLAVDTYEKCERSAVTYCFTTTLYEVQVSLLCLLRGALVCYKQNWLPFAAKITKALLNCLQRSRKQFFRDSWKYQKAVYEALSDCIVVMQGNLEAKDQDIIFQNILIDVSAYPEEVNFHVKGVEQCLEDNSSVEDHVCSHALNTAFLCLSLMELNISKKLKDDFFSLVVQKIATMSTNGTKKNVVCEKDFFKVYTSLYKQPYYCTIECIQKAINTVNIVKHMNNGRNVFDINSLGVYQGPPCTIVESWEQDKTNSDISGEISLTSKTNDEQLIECLEVETNTVMESEQQEIDTQADLLNSTEPSQRSINTRKEVADNQIVTIESKSAVTEDKVNPTLDAMQKATDNYIVIDTDSSDDENCLNSFHNTVYDL